MVAFEKAVAENTWARFGAYGETGSGKSFTGMMLAEALSKRLKAAGKPHRIALIDTEQGRSDILVRAGFDFDRIHVEGFKEAEEAAHILNPATHGVCFIDTMSVPWSTLQDSDEWKKTPAGTNSFEQWKPIKRAWQALIAYLSNQPMHLGMTFRQGAQYQDIPNDKGVLQKVTVGFKASSEKDTAYGLGLLIRMEVNKQQMGAEEFGIRKAFIEKCDIEDLEKDIFRFRKQKALDTARAAVMEAFKPWLDVMDGSGKVRTYSPEAAAKNDAGVLIEQAEAKKALEDASTGIMEQYKAQLLMLTDVAGLKALWTTIQKDSPRKPGGRLTPEHYRALGKIKDTRKGELNGAKI